MVLETAPSFSVYNSTGNLQASDENVVKHDLSLQRSVTIGNNVDPEFTFEKTPSRVIEEEKICNGAKETDPVDEDPTLFFSTGAEISFKQSQVNEAGDNDRCHPSHPMHLRDYAQFLLSTGDLLEAEKWFSRATQTDPGDGELLALYAKLIWEVHHDKDKATSYFKRAAETAPQNSQVMAAYASFLWDTEADDDDE